MTFIPDKDEVADSNSAGPTSLSPTKSGDFSVSNAESLRHHPVEIVSKTDLTIPESGVVAGVAEVWKPIAIDDRYEVSNLGRVRSFAQWKEHILKPQPNDGGYLAVGIGGKSKRLSRLVLEAFVGPCPDGREAAHLDGDKNNNRIDNLAWVTPVENHSHKRLHGTSLLGSKNHSAVLSEEDVREIKRMFANQFTGAEIQKKFPVSSATISKIKTGKRWSHVAPSSPASPEMGRGK